MDPQRPISPRGPLSVALRALAPEGHVEEPALGALKVLPRLLDLSGSVALAGALSSPLVHRRPVDGTPDELVKDLEERLSELEARLGAVFRGELPVSSPARMRRDLRSPGPSMDGTHPGVRAIRAPFTRYLQGNVFDVRSALSTWRLDLAPRIAALSEGAARLEAIDAALTEATSRQVEVLIARLFTRLDAAFAEDAKEALLALPTRFDIEHLEPWFEEGGWVPRYLAKVGAVVKAVYSHEASRLRALVRSACDCAWRTS